MNKNIQLVVFDMAGTTVNENNLVYKTLTNTLKNHAVDVTLDFVLEHGAGKEKHQAIKDILHEIEYNFDTLDDFSTKVFNDFKVELAKGYKTISVTSFPKVEDTLDLLKKQNIKIALNTGYNRETALTLLNKMNWEKGTHYDTLVTADDAENGRPHPDMIIKAMENLNISNPDSVAKIGDSIIDIEEGKNANCGMTIGVTTGAHTPDQLALANPDHIIDSISELTNLLSL